MSQLGISLRFPLRLDGGFRLKVCPHLKRRSSSRFAAKRSGFSMLEMLLALAILGTSLAVLAQLADVGTSAAREARALAMARLACQTKLSELLLNSTTMGQSPTAVVDAPVDSFDSQSTLSFTYSVEVMPAPLDGMLAVRLSVKALGGNDEVLATYALERWMIDPALGLEELEMEEEAAREEIAAMAEEAEA